MNFKIPIDVETLQATSLQGYLFTCGISNSNHYIRCFDDRDRLSTFNKPKIIRR
ncbi:hypothetical protein HW132_33940 [Brasilonema sp. CT11]|nr:hypothetical protein [Brasilonema sp. CT11]